MEGAAVVLADVNGDGAEAAARELCAEGATALAVTVDVLSTESTCAAVETARRELGELSVLVNAAGIISPVPSSELPDELWDRLIGIHLGGVMRMCRAAFPQLAAGASGAIVSLSSIAAHVGLPLRVAYNAAKAGVEGLTRSLAVEWAPHGIRVNAVAPGYTRTPPVEWALSEGLVAEGNLLQRVPLHRLAEPQEIGTVIAFLASERASYVTGQTLVVDGGLIVNGDW